MELPGDIRRKILNKIPIVELKLPVSELTPEYLRYRTQELFGETLETGLYLSPYEKYIQISSFNGEVCGGSVLHIPESKILLNAIKDKTVKIIRVYEVELDTISTLAALATGNLQQISWLSKNRDIHFEIYIYNPSIPKDTYITLYRKKILVLDDFTIGLIVSLEDARNYVKTENTEYWLGVACSLDIKKFDALIDTYGSSKKKELIQLRDYILDQYDPKKRYEIELVTLFACTDILKKAPEFHEGEFAKPFKKFSIVYDMLETRAKDFYDTLIKRDVDDPKHYASIEYWSWRIYGKSYISTLEDIMEEDSLDEFDYYIKALNPYIQMTKEPEVIKNWCIQFGTFPEYIDLLNKPYLYKLVLDIFKKLTKTCDFTSDVNISNYLENSLHLNYISPYCHA